MRSTHPLLIAALALTLAGCSAPSKEDASHLGDQIRTDSRQAAQTARKDVDESAATVRVKTALATSDKLSGSHITVSTEGKVVKVAGTTVDEAQKAVASRIVSDTVGKDFTVENNLTVEKRAAQKK